ncbi:MAG: CPBP family intramembrane metalloprotease [Nitrospirae bacterium]|nr:CPBP family intramembrane metalloprotease [Nitrospirota bacterium]
MWKHSTCNIGNGGDRTDIPFSFVSVVVSIAMPLCLSAILFNPIFKCYGRNPYTYLIARLIATTAFSVLPIYYFAKIYKIKRESFGLCRAGLSLLRIFAIGAAWASVYFIISMIIYVALGIVLLEPIKYSVPMILLMPITFQGFTMIFASPVAEEIVFRGVILKYLTRKCGFSLGLVLQALLFGYLHNLTSPGSGLFYVMNCSLLGGFYGLLFKKTGSLYPSMACHGILNYFMIISNMWP